MKKTAFDVVMLVDDYDSDNFVNKRLLEIRGLSKKVVVTTSGVKALEYLKNNAQNEDELPELILLDIKMPVMDGHVFLYNFEDLPEQIKAKCKIAILSSTLDHRDIKKVLDNQYVVKFIPKPLSEEVIHELMSEVED